MKITREFILSHGFVYTGFNSDGDWSFWDDNYIKKPDGNMMGCTISLYDNPFLHGWTDESDCTPTRQIYTIKALNRLHIRLLGKPIGY